MLALVVALGVVVAAQRVTALVVVCSVRAPGSAAAVVQGWPVSELGAGCRVVEVERLVWALVG